MTAVVLDGGARARAWAEVARGDAPVVGWGAVAALPDHLRQCPLPLRFVVDSDPARWGTTVGGVPVVPAARLAELPPETLVVSYPHHGAPGPAILRAIAALGPFRVLAPLWLPDDGPGLVASLGALPARPAWADELLALARQPSPTPWLTEATARADAVPGRIVAATAYFHAGGAERQLAYLAGGLARLGRGSEVVSLAPATFPPLTRFLDAEGVPVTVLPSARDRAAVPVDPELAEVLRRVPAELAHGVAALHAHLLARRPAALVCYLENMCVMGGLAGVLAGVPRVLLSFRNVSPDQFAHYWPQGLAWHRALLRALGAHPRVVLSANTEAGARSCAAWLDGPAVSAIPNAGPEELAGWDVPRVRREVRGALGLADDDLVLAGVFRLVPEKQPEVFVDALGALAARHPRLRGLLVGDGPQADAVRARAAAAGVADRLVLPGAIDGPRAIAAADLLLHPSRVEGMPNVLLEAQFLGVPSVAFDVGGVREALAPVQRPWAVPAGDVAALVAAADRLLSDREARRALGAGAADDARARFSLRALAERTLAALGG